MIRKYRVSFGVCSREGFPKCSGVTRHARGGHVHHTRVAFLRADERELPVDVARRGRRRDPLRFRTAWWLHRQHTLPREELAVRDRATRRNLRRDRARGTVARDGVGCTEQQHVGTVGRTDQRDDLTRFGLFEERYQEQPRVRGSGDADG